MARNPLSVLLQVVQKGCGALVKMVVGRMEIALDHGKRALAVLAALQRSTPDAGPLSQARLAGMRVHRTSSEIFGVLRRFAEGCVHGDEVHSLIA